MHTSIHRYIKYVNVCVIGICVDYLQSRLILQARLRVKRSKVEASALCSTGGLGG